MGKGGDLKVVGGEVRVVGVGGKEREVVGEGVFDGWEG